MCAIFRYGNKVGRKVWRSRLAFADSAYSTKEGTRTDDKKTAKFGSNQLPSDAIPLE